MFEAGFDVVAPSLPGFGFSDRPVRGGMNTFRIAELWVGLMGELGYPCFVAQGGDFGASVSTILGLRHADRVAGIHLNYIPVSYRPALEADCGGDVETRFTKDELLAHVTLYWMTETISSSFRLYNESKKAPLVFAAGERVRVPCGIARFPLEAPFPPREWVARGYNIERWTEMARGGHFAAAEEPELLAADMRQFFSGVWERPK